MSSRKAKAKPPAVMKLRLTCVECGAKEDVPFSGDRLDTSAIHRECGWILSLISNVEPFVLAPVCKGCAERIYPEELLKAARERYS